MTKRKNNTDLNQKRLSQDVGIAFEDLHCYTDEDVPAEVGSQFGTYVISCKSRPRRVEVHLFRGEACLTAYVKKERNITVAEAHRALVGALTLLTSAEDNDTDLYIFYDSYSLCTS